MLGDSPARGPEGTQDRLPRPAVLFRGPDRHIVLNGTSCPCTYSLVYRHGWQGVQGCASRCSPVHVVPPKAEICASRSRAARTFRRRDICADFAVHGHSDRSPGGPLARSDREHDDGRIPQDLRCSSAARRRRRRSGLGVSAHGAVVRPLAEQGPSRSALRDPTTTAAQSGPHAAG
jgi:hypothetical protein